MFYSYRLYMHKHILFFTVCLGLLMSTMTTNAVSVALSVINKDLNTTLVWTGWVLSVYSLTYTVIMPLSGRINEILGRRTAYLAHICLFVTGSTLCTLAPNIYLLIAARALQGIGGGGFFTCAAAIVADEFPTELKPRYIGLLSNMLPIGIIIGPNIGGLMVQAYGWRSLFLMNIPLGIIVIVLSIILLRGRQKKSIEKQIDFAGAGLLFGSIFALMLGLTESKTGAPWALTGTLFALSIGLLIPFVYMERRAKIPIIDLQLLRRRPFMASNVYNFIYGIGTLGIFTLIPLYATSVYKMSVLESGILLTPRSIAMITLATISSFYLMKWGYRRPMLIGMLLVSGGFALLAWEPQEINVLGIHVAIVPLLFVVMCICGVGQGTCSPAANNACIELMPDKVATISGLRGMFRQLGSALGVSVSTIILNTMTDISHAFRIVFVIAALLMLVAIPMVFSMPAAPNIGLIREKNS